MRVIHIIVSGGKTAVIMLKILGVTVCILFAWYSCSLGLCSN